jgi:quercetin dioxygenase-like cupin family protein
MGTLATFLAESKDTNGRFGVFEILAKPGTEPPPHRHSREDELLYVLEGELEAYVGTEAFWVGTGECIFFPRPQPHAFRFRSPRCRILGLVSPAGLEGYFRAMSAPAERLDFPTEAVTYATADLAQAVQLGAEYGISFLSPEEIADQLPLYPGRPVPVSP